MEYKNEHVLLIDNQQSNLDAWSKPGGFGYLFSNDDRFRQDAGIGLGACQMFALLTMELPFPPGGSYMKLSWYMLWPNRLQQFAAAALDSRLSYRSLCKALAKVISKVEIVYHGVRS